MVEGSCGVLGHPDEPHICLLGGVPVNPKVVAARIQIGKSTYPRAANQEWLVAYSVVHKRGQHVARAYMLLPVGEIVTRLILEKWEHELHRQYREFAMVTVSVISFQPL